MTQFTLPPVGSLLSTGGVGAIGAVNPLAVPSTAGSGANSTPAFGEVMNDYLQQVNGAQQHADQMVESLALGEPVDVHQVMLSLNQASTAMNLTLQLRNKALDAYQELMRLPM